MKKLIFLFLLVFSFNIFSEETQESVTPSKPSKLFEGVDLDRILREIVEKLNKELGVDVYLEEMNKLIEELKEEESDPG